MDPKANMAEQLALALHIVKEQESGKSLNKYSAWRLAELVIALDEWQRNGGFSPYDK